MDQEIKNVVARPGCIGGECAQEKALTVGRKKEKEKERERERGKERRREKERQRKLLIEKGTSIRCLSFQTKKLKIY